MPGDKATIEVRAYKKEGKKWKYWKTIKFSDFKYFVEVFVTRLLEKGYKPHEYQGSPGLHLMMLRHKQKKISYQFDINSGDMKWLVDYIGAWQPQKE